MQGTNIFSPLAVRALLASAALFTSVSTSTIKAQTLKQQDQQDETTILPETSILSYGNDISFPRPLTLSDERRIRHIFDLQRKGDFITAQSETIQISNNLLLGDILAERYLNPRFSPHTGQLKLWLKNFSSYPDSSDILKRLNGLAATKISIVINHNVISHNRDPIQKNAFLPVSEMPDNLDSNAKSFKRNPLLDRTVIKRSNLGIKGAKSALRLIRQTPGMNDLYAAQLHAEIAQQLFAMNESDFAFHLAAQTFTTSKKRIGLAGYTAGLIAWKNNQTDTAFTFFSEASRSDIMTENIRAGSFFWAARSKLKENDLQEYKVWLRKSASFTHTFYGMLANRILTENHQEKTSILPLERLPDFFNPESTPTLTSVDLNALEATQNGQRFFALLQVGEKERAKTVLEQIWVKNRNNLALLHSIQLIAAAAGYRDLSKQLQTIIIQNDNHLLQQEGNLPLPTLHPQHGYKINPALVYALIRLESNFNNKAVSNAGARGLMQIMPITAKYIAKQQDSPDIHHPTELQNTAVNLEIGQLYLIHLSELYGQKNLDNLPKGGSLIHMLASYNAGPTATSKWLNLPEGTQDPLLFMETIPIKETKDYLHKAFLYLWIYSNRLDLPSPSLDALAHDQWPEFTSEIKLAQSISLH